jgi:hypothetical protein
MPVRETVDLYEAHCTACAAPPAPHDDKGSAASSCAFLRACNAATTFDKASIKPASRIDRAADGRWEAQPAAQMRPNCLRNSPLARVNMRRRDSGRLAPARLI